MDEFNFLKFEKKWQKKWDEKGIFSSTEKSKKTKFYSLEMFPYPSGSGLHMGHALNYTIGDIFARFKLMKGFNVLHPIGYDALGLPAENAAIKAGTHPEVYTKNSMKNFTSQLKALGFSYDWKRLVNTSDPDYYKWDQWIFLKMLESGLAYQKESAVNWCPLCNTVLANEQVVNGTCWRHENTKVEIKTLKQWFLKITNYANELLDKIDDLDWPERTKQMQKHWIGKSYGTEIDFEVPSKFSNVIVVHGCTSYEEKTMFSHWMPWLKKELDGYKINSKFPSMPEPWKPDYEKWKKEFEKLNIDENSVLVGHSCGCAFLVRWIGETKKEIKKLILIAPWKIPFREGGIDKDFYDFSIDPLIKERVNEIVYFTSNDEDKEGKDSLKIYYDKLGGKVIELKNHGHFTEEDMGSKEFPELLEKIISGEKYSVFTTRPDTIHGVTFVVASPYHPNVSELVTKEHKKEFEKFMKKLTSVSEKDAVDMEKEGVFTGSYAVNPVNNEKIPVYLGNFVVTDYGSGMVMAVPAHDKRDFEFAKKYGIKIKVVIDPVNFELNNKNLTEAYVGEGTLINSGEFNGIENEKGKELITKFLEKKNLGRKSTQFRIKDWGISRQRYWGTPIPIIYCKKCGAVPVPEKDLPVKLPKVVKFGKGNPLLTNKKWINANCPKCKGEGKRETDTMDTFVNSSWYFLRYCDPENNKEIFNKEKVKYWSPVDSYIGGAEHACMHLIYSRFYVKFLRDIGLLNFDEPATKLFHQGMIHGEDGEKMSKSRGNVIEPLETIKKYGVDSLRFFLVSVSSPDKDFEWDEKGIEGSFRFLKRIYEFFNTVKTGENSKTLDFEMDKSIKEVGQFIEKFEYRKATIKLREIFDLILKEKSVNKKILEDFLKLLNPFCPHLTEELSEKLGNKGFLSNSSWPEFKDGGFAKKTKVNLNSKIVDIVSKLIRKFEEKEFKIKKVHLYLVPFEVKEINLEKIKKELGKEVFLYSVQDKNKYDPEGKSKKARPGMPGIWFE